MESSSTSEVASISDPVTPDSNDGRRMVSKKDTDMSLRSEAFVNEEDFGNIEIPRILKGDSFNPKIVDGEVALIIDSELHNDIMSESFKLVDKELTMQIFNGPHSDPRMQLVIKKLKQLGGGAQADVYQCRVIGMRGKFVDKTRKIYNNPELADKCLKEMYSEFCIAKDLVHPNIVEYKYFMRNYDEISQNYEFHILMELMEGEDMDVYLKEQGRPFMIDRVREIGAQLISGIRYLHTRKIIHQDLKPGNILFSGDYEKVKLIDLGVSTRLDQTKHTKQASQGTPRYMPPEQLNGNLTFKVDIWAFGCVLLQFCSGLKPFSGIENDMALYVQMANKITPLDYALKENANDMDLVLENKAFHDVLAQCFQIDYKKRPTANQLFNDPFFSEFTTE